MTKSRLRQAQSRRSAPRGRRRRPGGAVVEVAITLTILLNLTFGMVEFSYYFYCKNMFDGAAREGARTAVPWQATNAQVITAVNNSLATAKWPTTYYNIAITDTSGNAIPDLTQISPGTQIEVTLTGTWSAVGAGFRPLGLISGSKVLTTSCVMTKEF